MLDVNLLGPWRVTAAAIAALRESRGRVVNVASGPGAPDGPVRDRVLHEQARRGRLLGRAAHRARRRDHRDHRLPRLHPHADPRRRRRARAWRSRARSRPRTSPTPPRRSSARRSARPARDLATTRRGTVGYALLRLAPRRLVDRADALAVAARREAACVRRLAARGRPARAPARRSLSAPGSRRRRRGRCTGCVAPLRAKSGPAASVRLVALAGVRARPRDRRRRLGAGGRGDDRARRCSTSSGGRSTWSGWRAPTGAGSAA